jgi:putative RNA 2'-phosphotransferase
MNPKRLVQLSKRLSFVLRHRPDSIGIQLDTAGWVSVSTLLAALARHGTPLTATELERVVRENSKQRFALSEDGQQIRANQGHSLDVELGYAPSQPPPILYHGTADQFLASIRQQGLVKGARHHVHLSAARDTAQAVGSRHGRPVVLEIAAEAMVAAGHSFFVSANGVWLTEQVPAAFIRD